MFQAVNTATVLYLHNTVQQRSQVTSAAITIPHSDLSVEVTECIAQWAADKGGSSRIQWGKGSPACIWSLCPDRVKYFFVWGLSKGKPSEASWSLLCQKSDRKESQELLRGTVEMRRTPEEEIKARRGGGEYSAIEKPQGEDGCWQTQSSVGSAARGSSSATIDSSSPSSPTAFSAATQFWGLYSLGDLTVHRVLYPTVLFISKMILQTVSLGGRKRQTFHLYKIRYWNKHHYQSSVANVSEGSDCHKNDVLKWNVYFFPVYCSLLCS